MRGRRKFIQSWWVDGVRYRINEMPTVRMLESLKTVKQTMDFMEKNGCSPEMHTKTEIAIKTFQRKLRKRSLL